MRLNGILKKFGAHVTSLKQAETLKHGKESFKDFCKLNVAKYTAVPATSQLGQDAVALAYSGYKKGGFFVEFGATNGYDLSNTYLLEKGFSWSGILAEPNPTWHDELDSQRRCAISHKCVWTQTGLQLEFDATDEGEFSTISEFNDARLHQKRRTQKTSIMVDTISITDLLVENDAPIVIDYISIDTEGSERQILETFPFDLYTVNFFTIEHNYSDDRARIDEIMMQNGFEKVLTGLSRFDGWYLNAKAQW